MLPLMSFTSYLARKKECNTALEEVQKENVRSLLVNQELTDVIFEIGNEVFGIKEFHGIRAFFATQSDVLKSMLYGNMMESSVDNKVIINDIHPCGFEWFQSYCYGLHNVSITHQNISHILHICDKYCMKQCYNICLKQLLTKFVCNCNIDHLLHILHTLNKLSLAHVIDDILTSDEFGQLTVEQCRKLLLSSEFYLLPPILVCQILFKSKRKFISIANQYNLWFFLKHYCQYQALLKENVLCKDNDNETKDDLNNESKDDGEIKEPPSKRQRVMRNDKSNCNDNNVSYYGWTMIMREYFLKYFDFSLMNISFFMKNIYHDQGSLLTKDEKLSILEEFADNIDSVYSINSMNDGGIKNVPVMMINETAFGNGVFDFKFDENNHTNVALFEKETPFGVSRMYRLDNKRKDGFAVSSNSCIDSKNGRYFICNVRTGRKKNNVKTLWNFDWAIFVGLATKCIDFNTCSGAQTIHVGGVCGMGINKNGYRTVSLGNPWSNLMTNICDKTSTSMIKMILDIQTGKVNFYTISTRGESKLLTSLTISHLKNAHAKLYPYVCVGNNNDDPCIFVENTIACPYWPVG